MFTFCRTNADMLSNRNNFDLTRSDADARGGPIQRARFGVRAADEPGRGFDGAGGKAVG